MIEIKDKSQCTGCTACANVCTHRFITMCFDDEGHSYPLVDTANCVNCGLCEKVCPMLHQDELPKDYDLDQLSVYAVYNKDEVIRNSSTSGGIFTLLADYVIDKGGIVYAARFDEYYHIYHTSVECKEELQAFRGSKYAQSDLSDVFSQIKLQLRNERYVLFVGTPCQVAGLKSFLIKEYDKLYTCDFICMCISSPKIWEEYLSEYWDKNNIKRIVFKDKRIGWHSWRMLIEDDKGEHFYRGIENPFFCSYLQHITNRPSCFSCPFRHIRRVSDITIADCWGIDKVNKEFDDDKGCTTMILQSQKGVEVFNSIKEKLVISSYNIGSVIQYNPYIVKPIEKAPECDIFYQTYRVLGIRAAFEEIKRLNHPSLIKKIIKKMKGVFEV